MLISQRRAASGELLLILFLFVWAGCAGQRAAVKAPQEVSKRETVHFKFNKASVQDRDKATLDRIARWLQRDKKSVAILEGHTDSIGPARYNEILGENRARAVRVYLRDQGADPRRATVISKGEREPVVRGRTRQTHAANRRVEVFVTLTGRGD